MDKMASLDFAYKPKSKTLWRDKKILSVQN